MTRPNNPDSPNNPAIPTIPDKPPDRLHTGAARKPKAETRNRRDILSRPVVDPGSIQLTDLISLPMLQQFQDSFAALLGIPVLIHDTGGTAITTPSNHSDFCQLVRSTQIGRADCERIDKEMACRCQPDRKPFMQRGCVLENMIIGMVPICIQNHQLASIAIGQFTSGEADPEKIRAYARRIGIDEEQLLKAARTLPSETGEHLKAILSFLDTSATQLSRLAMGNLRQTIVTQQERCMGAEARRNRELFEKTFNCRPDALFILDTASPPRILTPNRSALRLFGYQQQEIGGQPVSMIGIGFETFLDLQGSLHFANPVSPGVDSQYHSMLQRKDSSRFPAEVHVASLEDQKGIRTGWILHVRDLSDAIQAIDAVNDRERNLHNLVEKITAGIVICSRDGAILFCNRKAADIGGYPPGQLRNMKIADLLPPGSRESAEVFSADSPGEIRREMTLRAADGTRRTVDLNIMPIHWQKERARLVLLHDITQKKMEQDRLIRTSKLISLGTLVSGVAHEINNPNNFIMLNIPLLEDAWDSVYPILADYAEAHGDFAMGGLPFSEMRQTMPKLFCGVREGADRIKRIVRDLKDFSRHKATASNEQVDINRVVKKALTLVSNQVRKSTDRFTIRYAPDLPPIQGDTQQLEQVVINLLQNACQALTDRTQGIAITTELDSEQHSIHIVVEDEGRGIENRLLPRLTDPFFTTRRDQGGTGLGLSVSTAIIRSHEGSLDIETSSEGGAIFTVRLPAERKQAVKNVLVVDDEEPVRSLLRLALQRAGGYRVIEASDGVQACIRIGENHPDLVVIDIQMPNMDGLEVIRKIKSEAEFADMKIMVLTGQLTPQAIAELKKMKICEYRSKPIDASAFLDCVNAMLS